MSDRDEDAVDRIINMSDEELIAEAEAEGRNVDQEAFEARSAFQRAAERARLILDNSRLRADLAAEKERAGDLWVKIRKSEHDYLLRQRDRVVEFITATYGASLEDIAKCLSPFRASNAAPPQPDELPRKCEDFVWWSQDDNGVPFCAVCNGDCAGANPPVFNCIRALSPASEGEKT